MKQKIRILLSLSALLSTVTFFFSGNHVNAQGFCTHSGSYKIRGDFDGDKRKDTLCTDNEGRKWIAYSNGRRWENLSTKWCSHKNSSITVGDFNGDGSSDLLCHDTEGRNWIIYSNEDGNFGNFSSDWTATSAFCTHRGGELYAKDINRDGRDDLVCTDVTNKKWYVYAQVSGTFDLR